MPPMRPDAAFAPMWRPFFRWVAAQGVAGAQGVARAMGGALLSGAVRNTLHKRLIAALGLVWSGLLMVGFCLVHDARLPPESVAVGGVFVGGLLVAALCGAAGAIAVRKPCWVELQAGWALSMAALWALLCHTPRPYAPPLGEWLAGPLWTRWGALFAGASALCAAWGAGSAQCVGVRPGEMRARWALEGHLLWRALVPSRKLRLSSTAAVAVVGLALGVGALVCVTAVMSGYQADIQERILATNAHVVVQKYGSDWVVDGNRIRQIEAVPGVAAAAPFAFNEAMIAANGRSLGVLLKGIDKKGFAVTDIAKQRCDAVRTDEPVWRCERRGPASASPWLQTLFAPAGEHAIYLGLSLMQQLGVRPGDGVSVMTPAGLMAQGQAAPRRERYVVAGAFFSGMHEFDSHLAYVALPSAQRLLGLQHAVSGVEVRVQNPLSAAATGEKIVAALGHYPFRALDWRALNHGIFTALVLQKTVMFLLLFLIVVVASFNIASTLWLTVMQKSEQIAILKSLGAQDVTVLRWFVLEGLLIGVLGVGAGLLLGTGCCALLTHLHIPIAADVYMVGSLRLKLSVAEVVGTVIFSVMVCQLAALWPAARAAGLTPMRLFIAER